MGHGTLRTLAGRTTRMVGGLAPLRGDDGGIVATHRWKPSAHEGRIPPGDRGIYGTFGTLRYDYGRRGGCTCVANRGMSEGTCTDSPTDASLGFKRCSIRTLPQHKQKTPGYCWPTPKYRNCYAFS